MYFKNSFECMRKNTERKRMSFVSQVLIEEAMTDNAKDRIKGAEIESPGNKRSLSHKLLEEEN